MKTKSLNHEVMAEVPTTVQALSVPTSVMDDTTLPVEPTVEVAPEPTVEMEDAPVLSPPEEPAPMVVEDCDPAPEEEEAAPTPPPVVVVPESGIRREDYETGDWYHGMFNGALREGKGLYVYAQGPIKEFEGDFKGGWGHGLGRFKFTDGGHYEGEVAEGNMHGCGKLVMASGATYTGMFNAGLMDGRGVHVSPSGTCTYKGEWSDGKKSGRGVQTSDAGDRYDGCWRDNLMQGEGTLFLANGDVYDGMFDKGKKNGHGTMTYLFAPGVHAKQYVGGWRKDGQFGRGLLTRADGTKVDGMWKDGHPRSKKGEHLWWDDVCFLCKHSASPVRNLSRMTCCETCPNVAHVECINTRRVAKGFGTIADPIPAACDFHCCERSPATGVVCEPAGYAPDGKYAEAPGGWESCGGTIVATPTPAPPPDSPSPSHKAEAVRPDAARSPPPPGGATAAATAAVAAVGVPKVSPGPGAKPGESFPSGNGGGGAGKGGAGSKEKVKEGGAGSKEKVKGGEARRASAKKEHTTPAGVAVATTRQPQGHVRAQAGTVSKEMRRACDAACAAVDALERENSRLRAAARNNTNTGEPTAVRFSGQQAATAQQLSHGAAATLVLTQLSMLQHQTPEQSPESRERLLLLHRDLRRNPWGAPLRGVVWDCDPAPATEADLLKVHGEDYLDFMRHKAQTSVFRAGGMSSLSDSESDAPVNETAISTHSVDAVLAAAGCVLRAVDATHALKAKNAFCLVRPPGHHAASDQSLRHRHAPLNPEGIGAGFCLVNNVLIGAKYAADTYAWRVAVIDFDAHHGNGTEQIIRYGKLKDEESLMLCSIHQYHKDEFPGTGGRENVERNDAGEPWIVNCPIPYTVPKEMRPNADDLDSGVWRQKVVDGVLPYMKEFKPDLILMSAGFDAHKDDPVGHMKLVEEDFEWVTKALVSHTAGATVPHVVSVLEGGYGIDAQSRFSLSRACCAHVAALTQLGLAGSAAAPLVFDAEAARAVEALSFRCGASAKHRLPSSSSKGSKRDASENDLASLGPARQGSPSKRPRPF